MEIKLDVDTGSQGIDKQVIERDLPDLPMDVFLVFFAHGVFFVCNGCAMVQGQAVAGPVIDRYRLPPFRGNWPVIDLQALAISDAAGLDTR